MVANVRNFGCFPLCLLVFLPPTPSFLFFCIGSVLVSFFVLLETFFFASRRFKKWMALHLEGYKTYSEVERAVMSRYFFFHLANVFVTIGAGSIKDVSAVLPYCNVTSHHIAILLHAFGLPGLLSFFGPPCGAPKFDVHVCMQAPSSGPKCAIHACKHRRLDQNLTYTRVHASTVV